MSTRNYFFLTVIFLSAVWPVNKQVFHIITYQQHQTLQNTCVDNNIKKYDDNQPGFYPQFYPHFRQHIHSFIQNCLNTNTAI